MKTRMMRGTRVPLMAVLAALALTGCGVAQNQTANESSLSNVQAPAFKVSSLSDQIQAAAGQQKPASGSVSDVIVQFDRIELRGEGNHVVLQTQIARSVSLLHKFDLFEGTEGLREDLESIREIRLHLADSGHMLVKDDGQICELRTPSGQQSGLKIKLPEGFQMEASHSYELEVVFDLEHSIVHQGNGGCLLKPVLRAVLRVVEVQPPTDPGTTDPGTTDPGSGDPIPIVIIDENGNPIYL